MELPDAGHDLTLDPGETVALATGDLAVRITGGDADWPLARLCAFAARRNSKRGFLIVSRVLGRHMPTPPSEMRASFEALAGQLDETLPGPVVFIGMAETAICLGQGVHAAYRRRSGRDDTLYLHSTRQRIDGEVLARFEEPHSHASAHLIYVPQSPAHRHLLATARSLVLVDDEASTGTTLVNLAQALLPHMPDLVAIRTVTLTDWSHAVHYEDRMPLPCRAAALLKGELIWHGHATPAAAAPVMAAEDALGRMDSHRNFGRLGVQDDPIDVAPWVARLNPQAGQRFLVLGTGEFTYVPYLLAQALEDLGHAVEVQATTRSPIHIGGAIAHSLGFDDNYATAVPNFLYNVQPEPGRRVIICHETPPGSVDASLVAKLDAECLWFGDAA